MENLAGGYRLPRNSFNTYGALLLKLFGAFALVVITTSSFLPGFEAIFKCYSKTAGEDDSLTKFINTKCSIKYEEKFHFILPMNVMFILNFGIVFGFSTIYAFFVKHRVDKIADSSSRASHNDEEDQNIRDGGDRECLGRFSTFWIYIVHLVVSRIPLLVFAWVFYSAKFPDTFSCPWQSTFHFNDTLNLRSNSTIIDCTNPAGLKREYMVDAVATANVCVVLLACMEALYILVLACSDREFMTDQEFSTVYLLRKRKRIRKCVNKVRNRVNSGDQSVFQINDDFGSDEISSRNLEEIYVDFVVQEGREHMNAYPKKFKRHQIYQSYLKTPKEVTMFTSTAPADILTTTESNQRKVYPRTILVIGRPGIGKTILAKKLLHQWKKPKEKNNGFGYEKIVILLQFHKFNNKTVTVKEMLSLGEGFSSDDFETVYDSILSNPTKTLLIFDALDELAVDNEHLCTNTDTCISLNDKMPVFSIFKMLVNGKLLRGITVLTTSRPTAQHLFQNLNFKKTVEILGFFREQIKEYVLKFCGPNNPKVKSKGELIWKQIKGSAELLSLCYIPVHCYIVCLTLKETLKNGGEQVGDSLHMNIPKTKTELYKRAVKVLLHNHHPKLKLLKQRPSDYLIAPFPKELEDDLVKLTEVARSKINKREIIFEQTSGDDFSDLANCGFFNKLPDKRRNFFCFLHLTIQEFLAALHVVDMDTDKVEQFLETHVDDPKWRLVIQFVAGLVGDKVRVAKMADDDVTSYPKEVEIAEDCRTESEVADYGVTNNAKKSHERMDIAAIQKRFEEWTFLLGTGRGKNKIALLGIECLYELQDNDLMKSVSSKLVAKGNGELCLEHLNITSVDSTAVFEFLGNNENLKRLQFNNCQIEGQLNCLKMEKSLFNNAANAISSFSWIRGITNENIKCLCNALEGGKDCKLIELHLRSINITNKVVEYLGDALKSENCKLTKLFLDHTIIGDKGVKYLCDGVDDVNCKLTELGLNGSFMTHRGVQDLCDIVEGTNCKITKLYLGSNRIRDEEVQYLGNACRSKSCKLTELDLRDNKITDQGVEYLSDLCKTGRCKLTKLCLGGNEITDQGVQYLGNICKSKNGKLIELDLNDNRITEVGVKELSEALESENCKLTKLCLGGNKIKNRGVEYLSNACKSGNCKTEELDLNNNKIRDKGVNYLSQALESENCKLTKIYLRGNKITDQGVNRLIEACSSGNGKVDELDLNNNNKIKNVSVKDLGETLKNEKCKLVKLYICGNEITDQGIKNLSNACDSKNVEEDNLDNNNNRITEGGVKDLCESLKNENCKLTKLYLSGN